MDLGKMAGAAMSAFGADKGAAREWLEKLTSADMGDVPAMIEQLFNEQGGESGFMAQITAAAASFQSENPEIGEKLQQIMGMITERFSGE